MREIPRYVALQLLRGYKWAISPMFPAACRYVPTCSEYAMEAVERYGVLRGGWMAAVRLMRCHPFAGSGYDPVVKECCHPGIESRELTSGAKAPNRYGAGIVALETMRYPETARVAHHGTI